MAKPTPHRRPLRSRFGRVLRVLAGWQPLTGRGVWVAMLAVLALWPFGFGSLDLVLFVLGITGLVLVVVCTVTVVALAIWVRRRLATRRSDVQRFQAGVPVRTGFRAPEIDRLPLVRLLWTWRHPTEVEVRLKPLRKKLVEEVVARRRTIADHIERRFVVEDVFGLTRIAWHATEPAVAVIAPDPGLLTHAPVVQALASAEGLPHPSGAPEGDRMDIRRYVPGDSIRHLMWKTYARTRQLNVRVPERSVDRSRRVVAYLLTGEGDEPAAAAARVALESGALGEQWLFGADGTDTPTDELDEALTAIARSGSVEAASDRNGLASFLPQIANQGEVSCVVFAPARQGAWAERALAAARGFGGSFSFVLGTDGVDRRDETPAWRRWLVAEPPLEGADASELNNLLSTLASAGGRTVVVDRRSGRSWGDGHRRAVDARSVRRADTPPIKERIA
ncbi:MAG: DUF58 domain-containing protein [Acidobacteriota bacterium]